LPKGESLGTQMALMRADEKRSAPAALKNKFKKKIRFYQSGFRFDLRSIF